MNNYLVPILLRASICIVLYQVVLLIIKKAISTKISDKKRKEMYLKIIKMIKKAIDALIYVPSFVFGILNYVAGIENVGLTKEFAIAGLILLIYNFLAKLLILQMFNHTRCGFSFAQKYGGGDMT